MVFIKTGISKIKIGLNKSAEPEQDELITALNSFVEIFDVTNKPYESIILVVVSRLSEKGINVKWNGKSFERMG